MTIRIGNKTNQARGFLAWFVVLIWIVFIFSFSSQTGEISHSKSNYIAEHLYPLIESIEGRFQIELVGEGKLHYYLRRSAHVMIYCVLSILCTLAWKAMGKKGVKPYLLAWVTATVFSILDEFYQTFVPGRSGQFVDILVDHIGIVLGLGLVVVLRPKGKTRTFKRIRYR